MKNSDFKLPSYVWCCALCWLGLLLPGCSLFPDKEKDYKYSQEIPELSLPPEVVAQRSLVTDNKLDAIETEKKQLKANNLEQAKSDTANQAVKQPAELSESEDVSSSGTKNETPDENLQVRNQQRDGKIPHLEINRDFDQSWRIVAKALGRAGLEIMDRNYSEAVFFIKYGDQPSDIKDGSIWDEVVFFFGGDPYEEETYHVQLSEQHTQQTFVIIADEDDEPLMEEEGIELLKLINTTIKKYFIK